MGINEVFELLGGLALFLFGMNVMSHALERFAGNQMKTIFSKLTSNKFKGFLLGLVVTALIQSSSATTVMVVGFVNSGIMTLSQSASSWVPTWGLPSRRFCFPCLCWVTGAAVSTL